MSFLVGVRRVAVKVNFGFVPLVAWMVANRLPQYQALTRGTQEIIELLAMVIAMPLLTAFTVSARRSENSPLFRWADLIVVGFGFVASRFTSHFVTGT